MEAISVEELSENTVEAPPGQPKRAYAYESGQMRMLPVDDNESVHRSARHFHQHRDSFPYEDRRKIARTILDAAGSMSTDPPHRRYLEQAAGLGAADMKKLARDMVLRANKAPEGMREELHKCAVEVAESDPDARVCEAAAELMAEIDETSGEYRKYASGRPMPEELAFTHTLSDFDKVAEGLVELKNGKLATAEQLDMAPMGKIAKAIGGSFENEALHRWGEEGLMRKLASTLSPPDADTLCAMLPEAPPLDLPLISDA